MKSLFRVEEISTRLVAALLLAVLFACLPAYCLARQQVVSEGGPYEATGKLQKFNAAINVNAELASRPLTLTFYNGFGGRPGFTWVRVFLAPEGYITDTSSSAAPAGEILADEGTFRLRNHESLDMSNRLITGTNNLIIEGEGAKGAVFSWVLSSPQPPKLSILNVSQIIQGREFSLAGSGFSPIASGNTVTFNGVPGQVVSSTGSILKVIPPKDVHGSSVAIKVTANGATSQTTHSVTVAPVPHLYSIYPRGGPPGETLTINGTNFSSVEAQNVVRIGPFPARVVSASSGTITVIIPDCGTNFTYLPVSVISDGTPSDNNVTFEPYNHIITD